MIESNNKDNINSENKHIKSESKICEEYELTSIVIVEKDDKNTDMHIVETECHDVACMQHAYNKLIIDNKCHKYMENKYRRYNEVLEILGGLLIFSSFSLSIMTNADENAGETSKSIPVVTILSSLMALIKGIQQTCKYAKKEKAHRICATIAKDLSDSIDYLIEKYKTGTLGDKIFREKIDDIEIQIASFRRQQEDIPMNVKHKFIKK